MENANVAKDLKVLAATKEFTQAIGAFVQAGVSAWHASKIAGARGQALKEEADGHKDFGKKQIKDQEDKIKDLEQLKAKGATDDERKITGLNTQAPDPKLDKQIKAEQETLAKMKKEHRDEVRDNMRLIEVETQQRAEVIKQTTNGFANVVSSLYTVQEGTLEKQKAMNEALLQIFNKTDDGINKAKDDLHSQKDELILQFVPALKAALGLE